jgi:TM2 domain-containing membrane protein YozV
MSFDTYKDNNEDGNQGNSPYGGNPNPQGNQNPSPYGFPSAPQNNQSQFPTQGTPGPNTNPPYAFNAPQDSYQAQQAAPAGGFSIFGLTWQKNIVPNPATNGMAPVTQKTAVVSYLLWFFLGIFGVHQFYLGNTSRGLFNLALFFTTFILGLTTIPFGIIYTAYWIYEAVTLNDQTNEVNQGYIRKSIL